jgi:hypothetical protein
VVRGTDIVKVDGAVDPGLRRTLDGLTDANGPIVKTVADRETVPEKPILVTLTAGVAKEPTLILRGGAGTDTLKSTPTVTVTTMLLDTEPLVPVTVIVYAPCDVVEYVNTESCEAPEEVPLNVTEGGWNDVVGPAGETPAARLTVPAKPLTLAIVRL